MTGRRVASRTGKDGRPLVYKPRGGMGWQKEDTASATLARRWRAILRDELRSKEVCEGVGVQNKCAKGCLDIIIKGRCYDPFLRTPVQGTCLVDGTQSETNGNEMLLT
jgi:hypothetical protein